MLQWKRGMGDCGGGVTILREWAKCSCGHANPPGTLLCESCGHPLSAETEELHKFSAAMRYEGVSRRSQSFSCSWVDRIWSWLSSVRTAILLISVTALAAGLGSFLPREDSFSIPISSEAVREKMKFAAYSSEYGFIGRLFYKLGLTDVYVQWWFLVLLSLICLSLIVCSLDRVVPLYRALHKQSVSKSVLFLQLQKYTHCEVVTDGETRLATLGEALRRLRYRVRREGGALLAEKGRWSRWGPYINHVGLILFFFGVALHVLPGWYLDESISLPTRGGREIIPIPGTRYAIGSGGNFRVEYHGDGRNPKRIRTSLVLYSFHPETSQLDSRPLKEGNIEVNEPFRYKELKLFLQPNQGKVPDLRLQVRNRSDGSVLGTFPLSQGGEVKAGVEYPMNDGFRFRILQSLLDSNGIVGEVLAPGHKAGEGERLAYRFNLNTQQLNEHLFPGAPRNYELRFDGIEWYWGNSTIVAHIDRSLPVIFGGGLICVIGLFVGSYGQHRRVWLRLKGDTLYLGAYTNKFGIGLERELNALPLKVGGSITRKKVEKGGE